MGDMETDIPSGNYRQAELDKFGALASRWWDEDGPQKALHALNPARLWDTMAVVGWPYLLLFFFLYLLNGGMGVGAVFVITKIGSTVALGVACNFVLALLVSRHAHQPEDKESMHAH